MKTEKKTKKVGSSRLLLVWGYICVAVSLLVYVLAKYTHDARMSIFYALVPVLGACIQGFVMDRVKTKDVEANGIAAGIVNRIWGMVGVILSLPQSYADISLLYITPRRGWHFSSLAFLLLGLRVWRLVWCRKTSG